MYGGCNFGWRLFSGELTVIRHLTREIQDVSPRVQVYADKVIILGMEKYKFTWNGESGGYLSTLEIKMELYDKRTIEKIITAGKLLYEEFDIRY